MEVQNRKKPRVRCLHGFRTSANTLRKLIGRLPETVLRKLDLVFLDGPFPAQGKSDVEGFYDPPYYEWFQANQDFTDYRKFQQCVAYIEDYTVKNGRFDGLLGFSKVGSYFISRIARNAIAQGVALGKIENIKFVILISGVKFGGKKFGMPKLASNAFSEPIDIPSLHFIGEEDYLKDEGVALLEAFVDPHVIHHPKGHTVPRLDDKGLETMLAFIDQIQSMPSNFSHLNF